MVIDGVFVFSLLSVFLRFKTFNYTFRTIERLLIFNYYDASPCNYFCNFLIIILLFLNSCIYACPTNIQLMQFSFSNRTSAEWKEILFTIYMIITCASIEWFLVNWYFCFSYNTRDN